MTVYIFAIVALIYFLITPKADIEPSVYMYPIFLAAIIYLVKEGYFKGIMIEVVRTVKTYKEAIFISFVILILIIFFVDIPLAVYFKELNGKNIVIINTISSFGNKLGNGSLLYSLIVMLFAAGVILKNKVEIFKVSLVSSAVAGIFVTVMKILISRERPPVAMNNLNFFAFSDAIQKNLFTKFEYVSMPSGHTITIVAAIIPLLIYTKSRIAKGFLVVLPLITIFDRVYTTAHWSSDTFAGAVFGIIIGISAYNINEAKIKNRTIL